MRMEVKSAETSPEISRKELEKDKTKSDHKSYADENGYLRKYDVSKYIGKYKVLEELGSGSSGSVFLAEESTSGTQVAIKVIKRKTSSDTKWAENDSNVQADIRVYREAIISSLINHPNIVRMLDFLYTDKYYFLVFQTIKGEQLYNVVVRSGKIPEERARRYFRQMLSAIDYLHRNSIVHRDLKIENVLVDENDNIKIIDFGLSNFYDNRFLLGTFCGSLYFAAPELLMNQNYQGPEIDVWSLGVILFVMLCGKVPFDDESIHALQAKIKDGEFEFPTTISSEAAELLQGMIVVNPENRMSLLSVKKSLWVSNEYNYEIETYMTSWNNFEKLDDNTVDILGIAIEFLFPNSKEELREYKKMCSNGFASLDNIYWTSRPVVSMYRMLLEDAKKRNKEAIRKFYKTCGKKTKKKHNIPATIHAFVKYVLAGIPSDLYIRYLTFKVVDSDSQSILSDTPIIWPTVKKTYLKGFFRGIKANGILSSNALKKRLMDVFKKKDISYETNEKGYFCTFTKEREDCYFKVSLYYNVIISEYFFVMSCLNSKQKLFKEIYKLFQVEFRPRSAIGKKF